MIFLTQWSKIQKEQAEDDADKAAVFTEPMGNQTDTRIKGDPNNMDFETYKKWREQNS